MQSKSEKLHSLGEVSADEVDHSASATKTLHAVFGYERVCCAVRQISKSVVREIRTLRSEGVGTANWAVPSTRRAPGNGRPYRDNGLRLNYYISKFFVWHINYNRIKKLLPDIPQLR